MTSIFYLAAPLLSPVKEGSILNPDVGFAHKAGRPLVFRSLSFIVHEIYFLKIDSGTSALRGPIAPGPSLLPLQREYADHFFLRFSKMNEKGNGEKDYFVSILFLRDFSYLLAVFYRLILILMIV